MTADRIPRHTDAWGRTLFDPADAVRLLYAGVDLATLEFAASPLLDAHNAACAAEGKDDHVLRPAASLHDDPAAVQARRLATWHLPGSAADDPGDLRAMLLACCRRPEEITRVHQEMDQFEVRGLVPLLHLLVRLVAHFRRHRIVWGVGRGSSVASYCLFLIGLHSVDALRYDLDLKEFLRELPCAATGNVPSSAASQGAMDENAIIDSPSQAVAQHDLRNGAGAAGVLAERDGQSWQ